MAKGSGSGAIRPVRIAGRTVGYQTGGHGYTTRREAEAAQRQNIARRIPGGEHMSPRQLSSAVRAVQAGGSGRTGPTRRAATSAGERGAAARNRMEARQTFRHRVFG